MFVLKPLNKHVTRQRVMHPNVLHYAYEKRNNGSFNDVTIEAGALTIAANRLILSCCSPFFEAMFDLEMKEKYQNPVQIHGVDGAAVKSVIDFMYSGEVKITSENVMELIAASDYLQVDEVKRFCFEFLESILSSDNWFAVYSAAKLYESEHLRIQVYEYVSNNFDDIVETDHFKSLANNDFVTLISKINHYEVKEISLFQSLVTWCRHDMEARKNVFPTLFEEFINLDKMSTYSLQEVVLKEELISKNDCRCCLKVLTNHLCQKVISQGETKIVSLGGSNTLCKCFEVLSFSIKSQLHFPDLPMKVASHCSVKFGINIYLIGGCTFEENTKKVILPNVWYLNAKDHVLKWKKTVSLNQKRYIMGSAVFRDTLVVAGGYNNDIGDLESVEYYHAAFDEWKFAPPLRNARCGCVMVAGYEHLYVLGGRVKKKYSSNVERISNLNEEWEEIESMQRSRMWFAAVICNEAIYAIGGQTDIETHAVTNTVEKYDFDEEKWVYVSSMNTERRSHAACVMNGKIYVVGGVDEAGHFIKLIECFDPIKASWSVVGETNDELYDHSLIVL